MAVRGVDTGVVGWLNRLVRSRPFRYTVITAIFTSILIIGLETYPAIPPHYQRWLGRIESALVGLFTLEIALRILAHGCRPWRFFRDGWNAFDFVIIAVCYLPDAHFASILRLARIIRALRLAAVVRQAELEHVRAVELADAYRQLEREKAKSEQLLLNVLPYVISRRLKHPRRQLLADYVPAASVLFADIAGFTVLAAQLSPPALVALLNELFGQFDALTECYDVEKIKTIGDAYMAVAGVPIAHPEHAAAIAGLALDMGALMPRFNAVHDTALAVRVGIHSGPLVAGVIGYKKFSYDLWGDTVNTASRLESHGVAGRIHISAATAALLDPRQFVIERRGEIELKNKGRQVTYWLVGRPPATPSAGTAIEPPRGIEPLRGG